MIGIFSHIAVGIDRIAPHLISCVSSRTGRKDHDGILQQIPGTSLVFHQFMHRIIQICRRVIRAVTGHKNLSCHREDILAVRFYKISQITPALRHTGTSIQQKRRFLIKAKIHSLHLAARLLQEGNRLVPCCFVLHVIWSVELRFLLRQVNTFRKLVLFSGHILRPTVGFIQPTYDLVHLHCLLHGIRKNSDAVKTCTCRNNSL